MTSVEKVILESSLLISSPNVPKSSSILITLLNQLSAYYFPGMISENILALAGFKNVLMYCKKREKSCGPVRFEMNIVSVHKINNIMGFPCILCLPLVFLGASGWRPPNFLNHIILRALAFSLLLLLLLLFFYYFTTFTSKWNEYLAKFGFTIVLSKSK